MVFWIFTAALTLVVLATMSAALLRGRHDLRPPAAYDLAVYRDQLKEVERDLARGIVTQTEAERIRTEVSRRILAADTALQAQDTSTGSSGSWVLAGVISVVIAALAYGLYLKLGAPGYGDLALQDRIEFAETLREERPNQETAEAGLPDDMLVPPTASPDYVALVEKLRDTVAERPDDIQGHALLVQSEARLGNFTAAYAAKARVVELKGDSVTASDFSEYADLMILAAGGYVSPEAEALLARALALNPADGTARYYFGAMMGQTGRPDKALRIWDQLLREGPSDAPWMPPIEAQIDEMAMRAGVNYARPAIAPARGPSAADIEAAGDMSPAERMEMIQGMVTGLSDRLATEGGPAEDWARLISALGVLGQIDQARAVFENAQDAFEGDPGAADILNEAADRVGLQ